MIWIASSILEILLHIAVILPLQCMMFVELQAIMHMIGIRLLNMGGNTITNRILITPKDDTGITAFGLLHNVCMPVSEMISLPRFIRSGIVIETISAIQRIRKNTIKQGLGGKRITSTAF